MSTSDWYSILWLLCAGVAGVWIYFMIRKNPDLFTWHNLNRSVTVLCILALVLIGFVALLVVLLKHH